MSERTRVLVLGRLFRNLSRSVCGGCEFIYEANGGDYDWLVVFDELPVDRIVLKCPRERTILCTWEPVSIKCYSRAYVSQFGHLLTNRPPLDLLSSPILHLLSSPTFSPPRYHLGRGYFPWFVHDVPALGTAVEKPYLVSAVCSAKQMRLTRHRERFRLLKELEASVPEMVWYGRGVRPLARKEEALVPFRYHVAIENHIGVHHWTEKFADAILCECLPFYAGDPALAEIFPAESFIPIPIDDPAATVRIVKEAIAADEYSRRREAVLEAKRLILEKYNFWRQVAAVIARESTPAPAIESVGPDGRAVSMKPPHQFLYSRRALRWVSPRAAMEDAAAHLRRAFSLCSSAPLC